MKVVGWLSSFAAGSGLILSLVSVPVQAFWSAHPLVASTVTAILTIVAHIAPSPTAVPAVK